MLGSSGVSLTTVTNLISSATTGLQSAAQVTSAINAAIAALPQPVLNFVGNGAYMTLADLHTNYPPSATYDGMYANINNFYNGVSMSAAGGIKEVARCRYDITNNQYRWMEQRPFYSINSAVTGATGVTTTVNLMPLVTPPTVRLTGTLLGNLNVTPTATNAYIGQKFKVIQSSVLGLFTTTLTGLVGSNLTLLGNTTQDLEFTTAGWVKASN